MPILSNRKERILTVTLLSIVKLTVYEHGPTEQITPKQQQNNGIVFALNIQTP